MNVVGFIWGDMHCHAMRTVNRRGAIIFGAINGSDMQTTDGIINHLPPLHLLGYRQKHLIERIQLKLLSPMAKGVNAEGSWVAPDLFRLTI